MTSGHHGRNLKLVAAVLGGGALIAMGVLTAGAVGGRENALTQPPTSTSLPTAPTEIETSVAEPTVTATTSQGEFPETPTVDSDVEPTASTSETTTQPAG